MIFILFYKTQTTMCLALVILRLKIPLIQRRERIYCQTIKRERNINYNDRFEKKYKFKINLLLLIKLITSLNLDEFKHWILYGSI